MQSANSVLCIFHNYYFSSYRHLCKRSGCPALLSWFSPMQTDFRHLPSQPAPSATPQTPACPARSQNTSEFRAKAPSQS